MAVCRSELVTIKQAKHSLLLGILSLVTMTMHQKLKKTQQEHPCISPEDVDPGCASQAPPALSDTCAAREHQIGPVVDNEQWRTVSARAIRNVVVIKFCHTRPFDGESAGSGDATGFVVDAEDG